MSPDLYRSVLEAQNTGEAARGKAGTVRVLDTAGDGTGPWKLFLGEYGVATWPSKPSNEDPQAYAAEVGRCIQDALADNQHGPILSDTPIPETYISLKVHYAKALLAMLTGKDHVPARADQALRELGRLVKADGLVCSLCKAPAGLAADGNYRHTGTPFEDASAFCEKYGYPIPVEEA